MTPHGTAIRAFRKARNLGLRECAQLAGISHSHLSRIERGVAKEAGDEVITRLARVLEVPPADITRGDDVSTTDETREVKREVPNPGTPEGAYFHYTPEEAAEWLPYSAKNLRRQAQKRQIPHRGNGQGHRLTLTGLDIREITDNLAVRPVGERPVRKQSADA